MASAFRGLSCLVCNQGKSDDTFDRHFRLTLSFRDTFILSANKSSPINCDFTRKQMGRPSSGHTEIPAIPR